MTSLCCDVLNALNGKTLVTAESCTGGMIGAYLTGVPGASAVYKGGVISYWSQIKQDFLDVDVELLEKNGPVSAPVAAAMAAGVRKRMKADVAISVTGLAGPDGDEFGRPVGTVFVGYDSVSRKVVREYRFFGDRNSVRTQAAEAALRLILENCD